MGCGGGCGHWEIMDSGLYGVAGWSVRWGIVLCPDELFGDLGA
jgi:hypothetical protein